jgi:hypothetical protein
LATTFQAFGAKNVRDSLMTQASPDRPASPLRQSKDNLAKQDPDAHRTQPPQVEPPSDAAVRTLLSKVWPASQLEHVL